MGLRSNSRVFGRTRERVLVWNLRSSSRPSIPSPPLLLLFVSLPTHPSSLPSFVLADRIHHLQTRPHNSCLPHLLISILLSSRWARRFGFVARRSAIRIEFGRWRGAGIPWEGIRRGVELVEEGDVMLRDINSERQRQERRVVEVQLSREGPFLEFREGR